MRICIDLDGVICKLRKNDEPYENLRPVDGAVDGIRKLKCAGHYVIIYTARRMKTHNSNVARVISDVGKVTLDWLDRYGIPYDELLFGKPWADLYIDDNAFRFFSWDDIKLDGSNLPKSMQPTNNRKMTFVIPMAGKGERFKREGFKIPKFMVPAKGKTLFEYSLESLPVHLADQLIFVCLSEHQHFSVSKFIRDRVQHDNISIISIEESTRGQAETVYRARHLIDSDGEMLIYNIDTYFRSKSLQEVLSDSRRKMDGVIGAFIEESGDEKWSFAEMSGDKCVIRTSEKQRISPVALTGLYHFTRADDFFKAFEYRLEMNIIEKGEFYIAPLYNDLIRQGRRFVIDLVDDFVALGTPEDVARFDNSR
jgi:capsule biosynthesis phosphatase